ncbi:MAG: hypothetical protein B7Y80_19785 [Hyphomicrobium sp. 32-62-53]|nr:MAG: hypothetical protein B7Z29_18090 [Hyphomicrobium sp. 12-62-95]OYX97422.1 MAG: hypothetical protein B7Y80_19785 [Hyphomicrobium sp. 32-62-53]
MVEPPTTQDGWKILPVDETFLGLLTDHYAQHHILAADGEGALSIERILKSTPPMTGRKTVVYADTGRPIHRHVERLMRLHDIELHLEPTILGLVRCVATFDLNAESPVRIYASGTPWMVSLICDLAERSGIDREAVIKDVRSPTGLIIRCLCCSTVFPSTDEIPSCSGCGTTLRIHSHYDFESGTYLGTPRR